MQKIVLFIEPSDDAFQTPFKSGHLFMNRFGIEEEANFEIVKTNFRTFERRRKTKRNESINVNIIYREYHIRLYQWVIG